MFAIVESAINLLDHLVRTGLGGAGKTASLKSLCLFLFLIVAAFTEAIK